MDEGQEDILGGLGVAQVSAEQLEQAVLEQVGRGDLSSVPRHRAAPQHLTYELAFVSNRRRWQEP